MRNTPNLSTQSLQRQHGDGKFVTIPIETGDIAKARSLIPFDVETYLVRHKGITCIAVRTSDDTLVQRVRDAVRRQ